MDGSSLVSLGYRLSSKTLYGDLGSRKVPLQHISPSLASSPNAISPSHERAHTQRIVWCVVGRP